MPVAGAVHSRLRSSRESTGNLDVSGSFHKRWVKNHERDLGISDDPLSLAAIAQNALTHHSGRHSSGGRASRVSARAEMREALRTCSLSRAYAACLRPVLVDPRTSRIIGPWDVITSAGLIFTALVTPFEAALLSERVIELFIVNRIIDMVFTIDLLLQFVLIFQPSSKESSSWETDPRTIAKHYLRGWFTIDLISILASAFDIGAAAGWFDGAEGAAVSGAARAGQS